MTEPHLLFDGPESGPVIVLAHGAGAPMDSPFLNILARDLGAAGLRVARFEFPYMRRLREKGQKRPPDREPALRQAWLDVIACLGGAERLVIGGKSMGGRMASLVADEAGVRGLVCLGYPFHPPGQLEKLRTAHLRDLRTPALIVQGTRDPFGTREGWLATSCRRRSASPGWRTATIRSSPASRRAGRSRGTWRRRWRRWRGSWRVWEKGEQGKLRAP